MSAPPLDRLHSARARATRRLRRRPVIFAVALIVAAFAFVACQETTGLGGTIAIDGSSTVFPIMEAEAEEFSLINRGVRVTVGVSGTGGGFQRFCNGETDISNASRPIKPSELEKCALAGIDFVEIPIAFDGLTIAVNPDNDFVDFLTIAELSHIWRPDSPANLWSEVRPGWPDEEITLFGPGPDSGTFDYFTETVNGQSGAIRSDFTSSEDDNLLVVGVAGEPAGLAYFGISYYENNKDRVRAVPIDSGDGPILPSAQTVNNGSYSPLSRPLLIYVRADALDREEIVAFIEFMLGEGRALIDAPEVGYVQLPAELYDLGIDRARRRITGTALLDVEPGADLVALYRDAS